jgi:hypothetical protein
MAETLGSLCDKLTIVKLKQFHSSDEKKLQSLESQENQLVQEIDNFVSDAKAGIITVDKLSFAANKVYSERGNETRNIEGNMGQVFSELAKVNCELWHEQEKVYEFEKVPINEKDVVVKKLAILNLERNKCIDQINNILIDLCKR